MYKNYKLHHVIPQKKSLLDLHLPMQNNKF